MQFNAISKENENFAEKLGLIVKDVSIGHNNDGEEQEEDNDNDKELASFKNNVSNASCAKSSLETVKDSVGKSFQAGTLLYLSYL